LTPDAARRKLAMVNLGSGVLGTFAWQANTDRARGIPAGILLLHSGHSMLIVWADLDHPSAGGVPRVELITLKPLSIVDTLQCASCPMIGRITEDRWVPDA
jgi:hypothetical protein